MKMPHGRSSRNLLSGTAEGKHHRNGKNAGVSRKTLSAILNGRAAISPEMAVRLPIAFDTSAESRLNQQTQYDLWHAEQRRKKLRVRKLRPRFFSSGRTL
jgi:addiction module HigA family antidote